MATSLIGPNRLLAGILGGTALTATAAHLFLAWRGSGAMTLVMAGMGLLCLSCLPHVRSNHEAINKSAHHLMVMSALMALVHLLWIIIPGARGHHHGTPGIPLSVVRAPADPHSELMLALVTIEILALLAASLVMRTNRQLSKRSKK